MRLDQARFPLIEAGPCFVLYDICIPSMRAATDLFLPYLVYRKLMDTQIILLRQAARVGLHATRRARPRSLRGLTSIQTLHITSRRGNQASSQELETSIAPLSASSQQHKRHFSLFSNNDHVGKPIEYQTLTEMQEK